VSDLVVTGVSSSTGLDAGGRGSPALDGRVDHFGTAPAPQLVKGNVGAQSAVASVTSVLAPVLTAGELLVARHLTDVINVNAAGFATFVFATVTFLVAPVFTSGVISSGRKCLAVNFLIHFSTSALNLSGKLTRGALAHVTFVFAGVVGPHRPTRQFLATHLTTRGHRVCARLSVCDGLFSTRTSLDRLWTHRAGATGS